MLYVVAIQLLTYFLHVCTKCISTSTLHVHVYVLVHVHVYVCKCVMYIVHCMQLLYTYMYMYLRVDLRVACTDSFITSVLHIPCNTPFFTSEKATFLCIRSH